MQITISFLLVSLQTDLGGVGLKAAGITLVLNDQVNK